MSSVCAHLSALQLVGEELRDGRQVAQRLRVIELQTGLAGADMLVDVDVRFMHDRNLAAAEVAAAVSG
jgi:hypothetical protein